MMKIKNYDRLISGGDVESRKVVLEILEASLQRLDSYLLIRKLLQLEGSVLRIGGLSMGPPKEAPDLCGWGREGLQRHGSGRGGDAGGLDFWWTRDC